MVGGVDVLKAASMASGMPASRVSGTSKMPPVAGGEDPAINRL